MIAMAIMIVTSILSLRGLPSEAKFGVQSIFYYILAAVVFLVPFSLVCAELASTYTRAGGLYRWVSEAFGPRWGWTAMYLEWQTIVIWFPTVLMFGAFLRLRRTQPNKQRGFRVPGGNVGKWVVTILGMGGALLALVLSYLPPFQDYHRQPRGLHRYPPARSSRIRRPAADSLCPAQTLVA